MSSIAAAHGPEPGLNWVRLPGAEACVSAPELAARVDARVGQTLFVAPSEAEVFVDGSVERRPSGYAVRLQVSDRVGRVLGVRELEFAGDDCAAITEPVALVIAVTFYPNSSLGAAAIALDPQLAARLSELFEDSASESDPATLPPAAAPQLDPEPVTVEPEGRGGAPLTAAGPFRETMALAAIVGGGFGTLPDAGFAFGLRATLRLGELLVEAGADHYFAHTISVEGGLGRLAFESTEGSLSACAFRLIDDLHACGGASLGWVSVSPSRFAGGGAVHREWIASGRVGLVYRPTLARALRARLGAFVGLPIIQRNFEIEGPDGRPISAFRMAQLAAQIEAGLSVSF